MTSSNNPFRPQAPLPEHTAEEDAFAAQLKATCGEPVFPGQWVQENAKLKAFSLEKTNGGTLPRATIAPSVRKLHFNRKAASGNPEAALLFREYRSVWHRR